MAVTPWPRVSMVTFPRCTLPVDAWRARPSQSRRRLTVALSGLVLCVLMRRVAPQSGPSLPSTGPTPPEVLACRGGGGHLCRVATDRGQSAQSPAWRACLLVLYRWACPGGVPDR